MTTGREIAHGLRAAYMLMHRHTQAVLGRSGVTADQYVLLVILNEEDGITQKELTKRATSDANTISAMVRLLEARNLVIRKPHGEDRRARQVSLTDEGRRMQDRLSNQLIPLQDALMSPFEETEARNLEDYLGRLADSMRRWEGNPE